MEQFDINSCQARDITNDGESHEFMGYCNNKLSFWCQGKYIHTQKTLDIEFSTHDTFLNHLQQLLHSESKDWNVRYAESLWKPERNHRYQI